MLVTEQVMQMAEKAYLNNDLNQAYRLCDNLLAANPDNAYAHKLMGAIYYKDKKYGVALSFFRYAVSISPKEQDAWNMLGVTLRAIGKMEAAAKAFNRAIEINPNWEVYSNMSSLYVNAGNPEKGIYWADRALALHNTPHARHHKAMALLEMGKLREGFALYNARLELPEFNHREYGDIPHWNGNKVKCLAIHGEQGLGDEILFLTWLEQLYDKAERIVIECAKRLVPLLKYSFREKKNIAIYGEHSELMKHEKPDAYIAMGSLPSLDPIIRPNTYLECGKEYPRTSTPRIGISWRGGTTQTHSYLRNTTASSWKGMVDALKAAGADVISLQYGDQMDAEAAKELGIPHDAESIGDIDTLAAMIDSCDLVISVCNTTIHMAGALGVPCWVLVPSKPAWRYLTKGDSVPWYESVKLYRQDQIKINQLMKELKIQEGQYHPAFWEHVLEHVRADALQWLEQIKKAAA